MDPETEEIVEEAPKIYEPVVDLQGLHDRIMSFLDLYNEQTGVQRMDLVMFQDALEHLMRISRIIGRPRGNAVLRGGRIHAQSGHRPRSGDAAPAVHGERSRRRDDHRLQPELRTGAGDP